MKVLCACVAYVNHLSFSKCFESTGFESSNLPCNTSRVAVDYENVTIVMSLCVRSRQIKPQVSVEEKLDQKLP